MNAPLRVGFLSVHNPYDRNCFSGTAYYMAQALRARDDTDLVIMGPHRPPRTGLAGKIFKRIFGEQKAHFDRLDVAGLDVIIAPVASSLVAKFAEDLPVPMVLITDATPAFLREFYGYDIPADADATETRALRFAQAAVYSSDYMADRARAEFADLPEAGVFAIPFGINLDRLPPAPVVKPQPDPLQLLFIGQDWHRKGGDIAIDALDALLERGTDAELTVVGCSDPRADSHPNVTVLGYLNKNDPADNDRLTAALTEAHVFVLPTRADCTPMVIAEANAYACPVLVTNTGGIGSLMNEGTNGAMLPPGATGAEWADAIEAMTYDQTRYRALSQSSHAHCHAKLTWTAWADRITEVLKSARDQ